MNSTPMESQIVFINYLDYPTGVISIILHFIIKIPITMQSVFLENNFKIYLITLLFLKEKLIQHPLV